MGHFSNNSVAFWSKREESLNGISENKRKKYTFIAEKQAAKGRKH